MKFLLCVLCVLCGPVLSGCAEKNQDITIRYLRSEAYTFSDADRRVIDDIASATMAEVRPLLSTLPPHIELTVRTDDEVTTEIGATGDALPPHYVVVTVDPSHAGGVVAVTRASLRGILFHEFHHLARNAYGIPRSLVEHAVFEGMATAFARDFAGANFPFGQYPDNVAEWATELTSLPAGASNREWMFNHPDGRRSIGYKVGTYWVDRAMAKSGKTSATLVATPAVEVVAMALER